MNYKKRKKYTLGAALNQEIICLMDNAMLDHQRKYMGIKFEKEKAPNNQNR